MALEEEIEGIKVTKEQQDREKVAKEEKMKLISQQIKDYSDLCNRLKGDIQAIILECTHLQEDIHKVKQERDNRNRELGAKSQQKGRILKDKDNKVEALLALTQEVAEREKKYKEQEEKLRLAREQLVHAEKGVLGAQRVRGEMELEVKED